MTSSESEGRQPLRKRARTNNSADDVYGTATKEGKKARGRPRVDTQDATAADRRRTQIRLAQRAYRQRKETTISSLKRQSSQLHSIIAQMNKSFVQFNDTAVKSGLLQLNSVLARELKHTHETFSALAKTATECEAGDDDQVDIDEHEFTAPAIQHSLVTTESNGVTVDIGMGYTITDSSTLLQETTPPTAVHSDNYLADIRGPFATSDSASLISRRQYILGDTFDQSRASQRPSHEHIGQHDLSQLPFGLVEMSSQEQAPFTSGHTHIFPVNILTPDITPPLPGLTTPPLPLPNILSTKTLQPVFTYSHDETSFARRLTRAALETGFQILSSADVRPAALNYVFRLSLPFLSLEKLRIRFKEMLSRGIHEDLDFLDTPFIHLGGAGTHYPRKDAAGNTVDIKNNWIIRQIGPLEKRMARVVNVVDGRWQDLNGLDLGGFEGEWFDAHDVEGYLEQHYSCRIDPMSSFAECLIEIEEQVSPSVDQHWHQGFSEHSARLGSQPSNDARKSISDPPRLIHTNTNSSTASSNEGFTPPSSTFSLPEAATSLDMPYNNNDINSFCTTQFSKFNNTHISFDQTLGLDLAPGYDYGYAPATAFGTDMALGLDMMGEEPLPVVQQKRKKFAWVDVTKLVDEVMKNVVCLGRAPGFRRKDIDMAMHRAVIPAY